MSQLVAWELGSDKRVRTTGRNWIVSIHLRETRAVRSLYLDKLVLKSIRVCIYSFSVFQAFSIHHRRDYLDSQALWHLHLESMVRTAIHCPGNSGHQTWCMHKGIYLMDKDNIL